MRPFRFDLAAFALMFTASAVGAQQNGAAPPPAAPPRAAQRPHPLTTHGHVRVDEYYWLKERTDTAVIHYLEAENAWTNAVMHHTKALEDSLFEEIKGRILQNDQSVPYRLDGYWYYTRFEEGKEYPIYCRKLGTLQGKEEVLLDVNALAQGHGFYQVAGVQVSSGNNLLAYAVDTVGRRLFTIRFRDLTTGRDLPDAIPGVTSNVAWARDNRTLFYTQQDPNTLRWYRIYRHVLGTAAARDSLVYEEPDETFNASVFRTKSRRFVGIASNHTLSSEYRFVDAANPAGRFIVIQPRERNLEYSVEHFGDHWYIRTNLAARNFRLVRAPLATPGKAHWEEVIPHRADVLLEGFDIFKEHLVLSERERGLPRLRVKPWTGPGEHYIEVNEPTYYAFTAQNPEFDTRTLRYGYSSLTTPSSTFDYDMVGRSRTLLKRDSVLGGYDPARYEARRLYARAADGVDVPISLVYRRDRRGTGPQPLLLYGYGSYGVTTEATFSATRLSLLDRGFVYAIAHVRGGEEMGRWWYEDGKLLKKKNTFTDFIAAGEHLVAAGYTAPKTRPVPLG